MSLALQHSFTDSLQNLFDHIQTTNYNSHTPLRQTRAADWLQLTRASAASSAFGSVSLSITPSNSQPISRRGSRRGGGAPRIRLVSWSLLTTRRLQLGPCASGSCTDGVPLRCFGSVCGDEAVRALSAAGPSAPCRLHGAPRLRGRSLTLGVAVWPPAAAANYLRFSASPGPEIMFIS